ALNAARDQVTKAEAVLTDTVDLVGEIGRQVLANLLDPRRPRVSTRKVKSPISRYHAPQDDARPTSSTTVARLALTITDPPHTPGPNPAPPSAASTITAPGRPSPQ